MKYTNVVYYQENAGEELAQMNTFSLAERSRYTFFSLTTSTMQCTKFFRFSTTKNCAGADGGETE